MPAAGHVGTGVLDVRGRERGGPHPHTVRRGPCCQQAGYHHEHREGLRRHTADDALLLHAGGGVPRGSKGRG